MSLSILYTTLFISVSLILAGVAAANSDGDGFSKP